MGEPGAGEVEGAVGLGEDVGDDVADGVDVAVPVEGDAGPGSTQPERPSASAVAVAATTRPERAERISGSRRIMVPILGSRAPEARRPTGDRLSRCPPDGGRQ
ncbi:hypothetical protein GCM10010988_11640 [Cnuibacter physcomitrellae]|nr:hypothetical protein GCM10010988_11640 [Cnuibacter physcomitrellae]